MTQNTKIILGAVLAVALVALGVAAYSNNAGSVGTPSYQNDAGNGNGAPQGGQSSGTQTDGQKCAAKGGTWSDQYKECTGIGASSCSAIGGEFDECESSCRHNPEADACIAVCVAVCEF